MKKLKKIKPIEEKEFKGNDYERDLILLRKINELISRRKT